MHYPSSPTPAAVRALYYATLFARRTAKGQEPRTQKPRGQSAEDKAWLSEALAAARVHCRSPEAQRLCRAYALAIGRADRHAAQIFALELIEHWEPAQTAAKAPEMTDRQPPLHLVGIPSPASAA